MMMVMVTMMVMIMIMTVMATTTTTMVMATMMVMIMVMTVMEMTTTVMMMMVVTMMVMMITTTKTMMIMVILCYSSQHSTGVGGGADRVDVTAGGLWPCRHHILPVQKTVSAQPVVAVTKVLQLLNICLDRYLCVHTDKH